MPPKRRRRKRDPVSIEDEGSPTKKAVMTADIEAQVDIVVQEQDEKPAASARLPEILVPPYIPPETLKMAEDAVATAVAAKPGATGSAAPPDKDSAEWNQMLFELISYKAEHGDFNVRANDPKHKPLQLWIKKQRDQYKVYQQDPTCPTITLTKERVAVMDYLQFNWQVRGSELWKKSYEKLKEFHAEHGHTLVSRGFLEVPRLGDWVTEQRRQYKLRMEGKTSTLTDEKLRLLEELNFVWKVRDRPGWDSRYQELVQFKEKHGHAKVPQHYSENKQLGKWVAKQREQMRLHQMGKHSFLTPDRVQQLNAVDFVWTCKTNKDTKVVAAVPKTQVEEDLAEAVHKETENILTEASPEDTKTEDKVEDEEKDESSNKVGSEVHV